MSRGRDPDGGHAAPEKRQFPASCPGRFPGLPPRPPPLPLPSSPPPLPPLPGLGAWSRARPNSRVGESVCGFSLSESEPNGQHHPPPSPPLALYPTPPPGFVLDVITHGSPVGGMHSGLRLAVRRAGICMAGGGGGGMGGGVGHGTRPAVTSALRCQILTAWAQTGPGLAPNLPLATAEGSEGLTRAVGAARGGAGEREPDVRIRRR